MQHTNELGPSLCLVPGATFGGTQAAGFRQLLETPDTVPTVFFFMFYQAPLRCNTVSVCAGPVQKPGLLVGNKKFFFSARMHSKDRFALYIGTGSSISIGHQHAVWSTASEIFHSDLQTTRGPGCAIALFV